MYSTVLISTAVPYVTTGDSQDDTAKRALTLAMLEERYPDEAWIHAYTDGSATDAMSNGGAGVYLKFPEGHTDTAKIPTGKYCSNYGAEVQALMQATSMIIDSQNDCQQVVLLTDSLSALEALAADKLPHLMACLQEAAKCRRVALQWIPAHCGIPGNEAADMLAKQGAQESQPDNSVSYIEKRTLVKAAMRPKTTRDAYHLLERRQQVVIMRLRTGHNRLNAHMNRKMKLTPTPTCDCGLSDQTAAHILQDCPLFQNQRTMVWPEAVPLQVKLHGSRQDLEKTTTFVSLTSLTV